MSATPPANSARVEGAQGTPLGAATLGSVRRRLLRGSWWVTVGKVATIPLTFLINRFLAHMLRPAEMGAYFAGFTIVTVGAIAAQLGLDRALVRFVARGIATGQPGQARQTIRVAFTAGSIAATAVAILLVAGPGEWLSQRMFHSDLLASVIPAVAVWLLLTALQELLVETFRGFQQFKVVSVLDSLLVDSLCALTFGIMLVTHAGPSVNLVIAISAAFTGIAALIGAGMLVRRVRRLGTNGRLQRGEIFSMAWPVMIADLASYLLGTGVDLLVLAAFRPLPEVALYGAATRLLVLIGTPFRILQGVIPPIISELHAQGKKQELERAVRSAASLAGFPAALVLIAFIVAGPLILSVVFTPFYRNAATILAILSFGRLIAIYTGSAGLTLMMTGHQKAMMVLTLVMGAVSLAAGIAAAPVFGGLGVAIATTVAAITQNVLQLVLARKYVGIYTQAYLLPGPVIAFFSKKQDEAAPT